MLFFVPASFVAAQTTSTEVLGTIADSSGAVVPNANVSLLRVGTGEKRRTVTDHSGNYSFPLIEIGAYAVTAELPGFKVQTKTGVTVELQQKARVDFQLEVGSGVERIEVSGTAIDLKTDDASLGSTIDQKRVTELPTLNRNFASLLVLTPGVQFGTRMGLNAASTGSSFFPGATQVSANGQRDANQRVTLDGVIASDPLVNTVYLNPSIDAIEEIKVQTGSYSAEYGMNNGANVQVALKSGSNEFRGSLFEFMRNELLDAKDYFLNFQVPAGATLQPKNRLRRNQFGTWFAGPVMLPGYKGKDKTFWSFNFEGTKQTLENVVQTNFANPAFRNGDFSALLTPVITNGKPVRAPIIIYDPLTGEPFRDAAGNINNIIPQNRINKNAQAFLNKYVPMPQFAPADILDVNTIKNVANTLDQNQYFVRIDHQFSPKDRIFVRLATQVGTYDVRNVNPNFPFSQHIQNYNVASQHIHIFSPRVLNEFRFGFNKVNTDQVTPRTNTDFNIDSLGIGQFRVAVDHNRPFSSLETGIPPISGIVAGDGGARIDLNGMFQYADNLSFSRGRHSLKTGIEIMRYGIDRVAANVPLGNMSCCPGGNALAGWLMGFPSATSSAEGLNWTAPRQMRMGAYLQDEWKATRRLTINMGLRWDFFSLPHDTDQKWRTLRLDVLSTGSDGKKYPTMVPDPKSNYDFYESEKRFFMPRLGLAYRATSKWVIRAGAGWFANVQQMNNMTILALQPPFSGTYAWTALDQPGQTIPYSYGGNDYNLTTRQLQPTSQILTLDNPFPGQGTTAARTNVLLFPPDNKSSSVVQWSFDIQRALPAKVFLTAGYVGSKTSHLDNTIPNFNSPDPSTNTDINSRRPFQAYVSQGEGNTPRLLGTIRYLDSYGNASHHALQVQAQKRYQRGLTAGLAYTYSKSLGEGYGRNDPSGGINSVYQNPRDRRHNRSRYGFDVTHNAVMNFVYEMPFFKTSKGFMKQQVLGGWQLSGIITLRTGFPFSVTGGTLNTGSTSYPDRVGDGRLGSGATRQLWFDPTAFRRTECNIPAHPELCHYGNAAPDALVGPGAHTYDFSFGKNWAVHALSERSRLQFRAEAFNALNTPQFGTPNGLSYLGADSLVPDGNRVGEIRGLMQPMRIFQMGLKLYF